jgi:hypothetical protein
MARRFDYRRVKIQRSHTIVELAAADEVHKQTVARWIASGLPRRTPSADCSFATLIRLEERLALRINDAVDVSGRSRSALYKLIAERRLRAIKGYRSPSHLKARP